MELSTFAKRINNMPKFISYIYIAFFFIFNQKEFDRIHNELQRVAKIKPTDQEKWLASIDGKKAYLKYKEENQS